MPIPHHFFIWPLKKDRNPILFNNRRFSMAQKLDSSELVSFKELLMANSIQVDTAVQLLIEKGFFTENEFITKMKQVQIEYMKKASV
jgi:hypothetical protein